MDELEATFAGKFGYEEFTDNIIIPYIYRGQNRFCATFMFDWHIAKINKKFDLDAINEFLCGYMMHPEEARLLNEINQFHNNGFYRYIFRGIDTLLKVEDIHYVFKHFLDIPTLQSPILNNNNNNSLKPLEASTSQSFDAVIPQPIEVTPDKRNVADSSSFSVPAVRIIIDNNLAEQSQTTAVNPPDAMVTNVSETSIAEAENISVEVVLTSASTNVNNNNNNNNDSTGPTVVVKINRKRKVNDSNDVPAAKVPKVSAPKGSTSKTAPLNPVSKLKPALKKTSTNIPKKKRTEEIYEVDKLVDYRITKGGEEVLIHWKGYSSKYDTWEPIRNLNEGLEDDLEELRNK